MARGSHAAPSRLRPRAIFGPIRPGWEQVPATDPYGLRAKKPANIAVPDDPATSAEPAPAPPAQLPARVREPALVVTLGRLAEIGAVALAAVWLAVAAFTRAASGDEVH